MNTQDRLATWPIRRQHSHSSIEAAGPQERLVEHIRAVCGRQHDDTFAGGEPVHLSQDLVERLLLL